MRRESYNNKLNCVRRGICKATLKRPETSPVSPRGTVSSARRSLGASFLDSPVPRLFLTPGKGGTTKRSMISTHSAFVLPPLAPLTFSVFQSVVGPQWTYRRFARPFPSVRGWGWDRVDGPCARCAASNCESPVCCQCDVTVVRLLWPLHVWVCRLLSEAVTLRRRLDLPCPFRSAQGRRKEASCKWICSVKRRSDEGEVGFLIQLRP